MKNNIVRWILGSILSIVLLVSLSMAGIVFYINSENGRAYLSRLVSEKVGGENLAISIGKIGTGLPSVINIQDIAVGDAEGEWLRMDELDLSWKPSALLKGKLHIVNIDLANVVVTRQPKSKDVNTEPFSMPSPPVSLALDGISIDRLFLEKPVFGEPIVLRAEGAVTVDQEQIVNAHFFAETSDDEPSTLSIQALFHPDNGNLKTNADLSIPSGGVLSKVLGIDGLILSLSADGPIDNWYADLQVSSGDAANLSVQLHLSESNDKPRLVVAGNADIDSIVGSAARELVENGVNFSIDVSATDNKTLLLRQSSLSSEAISVNLEGSVSEKEMDLNTRVSFAGQGVTWLNKQQENMAIEDLILTMHVAGPALQPVLDVRARSTQITMINGQGNNDHPQTLTAAQVGLNATVLFEQPLNQIDGVVVRASANMEIAGDGDDALIALMKGPLGIDLESKFSSNSGVLAVSSAMISSGWAEFSANGEIDILPGYDALQQDEKKLHINAEVDLPDLSLLESVAGPGLGGAFQMRASLESSNYMAGVSARLAGTVTDLKTGQHDVNSVVGTSAEISADIFADANGELAVENLLVSGDNVKFTGSLGLSPKAENLWANYHVELDELSNFDSIPSEIQGKLVIDGTLAGKADNPTIKGTANVRDLYIYDYDAGVVQIEFEVGELNTNAEGQLSVTTEQSNIGRVEVFSRFVVQDFEKISLHDLELQALDSVIIGDMDIPFTQLVLQGNVSGKFPNLQRWGRIAGVELAGNADLNINFDEHDHTQHVEARGQIDAGQFYTNGEQSLAAKNIDITVEIMDLFEAAHGTLALEAKQASLGTTPLQKIIINVEAQDSAEATVNMQLEGDDPDQRLSASGVVSMSGDGIRTTISDLQGRLAEHAVSLDGVTTIFLKDERLLVDDLSLNLSGGKLTGNVDLSPGRLGGEVDLHDIPLSLIDLFHGGAQLGGTLSGKLTLSGTKDSPNGKLKIQLSEMQQQTTTGKKLPKFTVDVDVDWIDNQFILEGKISDQAMESLAVNLIFPMELFADSLMPSIPDVAQVSGQVNGQFQIESFLRYFPLYEYRFAGTADIDIGLSGAINSPVLSGAVRLQQGSFESFATATLIKDIALTMGYQEEKISFSGSASDGQNGTISLQGAINLASESGYPFDVALDFNTMTLIGLDELTARASGNLKIGGTPGQIKVEGELVTNLVEVYIDDSGAMGVVELDVTEINHPESAASNNQQTSTTSNLIELDLNLSMPNRVFLRGSGLDSEWAGEFGVTGDALSPVISGELRPIRGSYTLLGKIFTLKTGSVRIDSVDELDPVINLPFEYVGSNVTAVLEVSGTASQPEIILTSRPPLPQSEIVSRVLFGEDSQTLSAGQKLELASAVVGLRRGGPGAIDRARGKLGVDVLTFDEGQDDGATTVKAGKYVTERVYLEVKRGANEKDDATTIEYELTPNVKVQTGTKGNGGGQVGIEWRRDY